MLTGLTTKLAGNVMPKIFASIGNCFVNVIRPTSVKDNHGGTIETDSVEYEDIPARYEAKPGNTRFVQGGEWTFHKFTMPLTQSGELIGLKPTDKILRQATDLMPEKIFTVVDARQKDLVLYEVNCTIDNNEE